MQLQVQQQQQRQQPFLVKKLQNNKLSICFFLRIRKEVDVGIIYYKVSVNNKSTREKSTGIRVLLENWDKRRQMIIGNESENRTLSIIKSTIRDTYNTLLLNNSFVITPDFLVENYFSKFGQIGLFELCQKYFERIQKDDLRKSTIKGYKGVLTKIKSFLERRDKDKFSDIPVMQFSPKIADDFFIFLRKTQGINHASMHIGFIHRSINYGINILKIINQNPILAYKVKKEAIFKDNHISMNELKILENANINNLDLQNAIDFFLFQCYTGLAYSDACRFSAKKHLHSLNGKMWIFINRQKVKNSICEIPFFTKTKAILQKHEYQLPQMSYSKYMKLLRKIQNLCNINSIEKLTSHSGRKTLGNMILESGGSLDVVSKMYGHSSLKTTQKYYNKISRDRVASEMQNIGFSW